MSTEVIPKLRHCLDTIYFDPAKDVSPKHERI